MNALERHNRYNGARSYSTNFNSLANWAQLLGTLTAAGGQVTCSAMAADGKELVSNGNMETGDPPTGWDPTVGSTLDGVADERTGGSGAQSLDIIAGGNQQGALQTIAVINGATYALDAWARRVAGTGSIGVGIVGVVTWLFTASETWTQATSTRQAAAASWGIKAFPYVISEQMRADDISVQRRLAITTAPRFIPNGTLERAFYCPAVATTPRCPILFRVARTAGQINHWEVRVTPNTAGTDLELIENNAGTMTQRIAVDVDWTADAVNRVKVDFRGPTIKLYHWKSGAAGWTLGGTYSTATFGMSNGLFGIGSYQAAALGAGSWLKAVSA